MVTVTAEWCRHLRLGQEEEETPNPAGSLLPSLPATPGFGSWCPAMRAQAQPRAIVPVLHPPIRSRCPSQAQSLDIAPSQRSPLLAMEDAEFPRESRCLLPCPSALPAPGKVQGAKANLVPAARSGARLDPGLRLSQLKTADLSNIAPKKRGKRGRKGKAGRKRPCSAAGKAPARSRRGPG